MCRAADYWTLWPSRRALHHHGAIRPGDQQEVPAIVPHSELQTFHEADRSGVLWLDQRFDPMGIELAEAEGDERIHGSAMTCEEGRGAHGEI
jgi:uncharacterized RmlC-like cupin family protein